MEKQELWQHWLAELQRPSKTLTPWELGFLSDISDKLDHGWNLTEGQATKLEEIYADKTA